MSDYVRELKRLGYLDTLKEFNQKVKIFKIESIIDQSFCSALMKNAFKKLINKRFQELQNGLQD